MSEFAKPGQDEEKSGWTRRDFLKALGIGAATVVAGGAVSGCEKMGENKGEMVKKQMEAASTETMEIIPQKQLAESGKENCARTISELRDAGGWSSDYNDEFIAVMRQKYPKSITENGVIQPGFYEVPMNPEKSKAAE